MDQKNRKRTLFLIGAVVTALILGAFFLKKPRAPLTEEEMNYRLNTQPMNVK